MRYILCLDPGGTTGWALFTIADDQPLTLVDCGMIPGGLRGFKKWWKTSWAVQLYRTYRGTLIVEDFLDDGRTQKPDLQARDIISGLTMHLDEPFILQRNQMKGHAPDVFLKKWGLWQTGAGHDRDAIRHGFAYVRTLTPRHKPSYDKYWPDRRGKA